MSSRGKARAVLPLQQMQLFWDELIPQSREVQTIHSRGILHLFSTIPSTVFAKLCCCKTGSTQAPFLTSLYLPIVVIQPERRSIQRHSPGNITLETISRRTLARCHNTNT